MAAKKRKPAIERPEGIIDDFIIPAIRKKISRKTTVKLAKHFEKKSNVAEMKTIGKVYKKEIKNVNKPKVTSYGIRKQSKKSYVLADRADALYMGRPTRGLAKKAKKRAPKTFENEHYLSREK